MFSKGFGQRKFIQQFSSSTNISFNQIVTKILISCGVVEQQYSNTSKYLATYARSKETMRNFKNSMVELMKEYLWVIQRIKKDTGVTINSTR